MSFRNFVSTFIDKGTPPSAAGSIPVEEPAPLPSLGGLLTRGGPRNKRGGGGAFSKTSLFNLARERHKLFEKPVRCYLFL